MESIRTIINRALIPPNDLPPLFNYLFLTNYLETKKRDEYFKKCQCIVISNTMDKKSIDLIRRCYECDVQMNNNANYSKGFVSTTLQI